MTDKHAEATRIYCSDLAREAQAPLEGSAVQVDLWLLLEYPRPWKPKALLDNDLPIETRRHLDALPAEIARLSRRNLRVQFIKQAASADIVKPRVYIAERCGEGARLVGGTLDTYNDIADLQPRQLLDLDVPNAVSGSEEMYLVCTNGQRDLCCARYGLPVFETLRVEFGSRVWQTTHIGGHRYAPNLLCLPSGVVYGFVDPSCAVSLVHDHDAGRVSIANLRGTSSYPPLAQAAEFHLRRRLGLIHRADCRLVKMVDETVTFAVGDSATWNVLMRQHADAEQVVASCDAAPKATDRYELLEVAPRALVEN